MNWDTIIGILIILFIILSIWAKVSKQTIVEVIGDIKNMLSNKGEDIEERLGEVIEYE